MGMEHNVVNCDFNYYIKVTCDEEQWSNFEMRIVSYEKISN